MTQQPSIDDGEPLWGGALEEKAHRYLQHKCEARLKPGDTLWVNNNEGYDVFAVIEPSTAQQVEDPPQVGAKLAESSIALLRRAGEDVRRVAAIEGLESDPRFGVVYRLLAELVDSTEPTPSSNTFQRR